MATGGKTSSFPRAILIRLQVGLLLAAVLIAVPAYMLNTGSHERFIAALAVLGCLLVVPLFVAFRPGSFNIFEPVWLYVMLYGMEFWLKPMLVLNYPDRFSFNFFSYQKGAMLEALVLGCAGLATFYAGYYLGPGRALAAYVPALKWPWPEKRRRAAWLICVPLFGALLFYFLQKGNFSLEYMLNNRQEVTRGSGEFIILIHVVAWFVVILPMAGFVENQKRKQRLAMTGLVCVVVMAGMSVFAARVSLLMTLFSLVIIWHFTVRRISFRSATMIFLALFLASTIFGAYRGSPEDVRREDTLNVTKGVADELASAAGWDALSDIVAFYPKRRDFFWGQLAEESLYWLIPRRIWKGKPEMYGPVRIQMDIAPGALVELPEGGYEGTYLTQTTLGEGYADFGWAGALLYMFLFATAWRLLFEFQRANEGNFPSVAVYAIVFSQLPVLIRGFSTALIHIFLWFASVYVVFKFIERPFLFFGRHDALGAAFPPTGAPQMKLRRFEEIKARNHRWFPTHRPAHEVYLDEIRRRLSTGAVVCQLGAGRDLMGSGGALQDVKLISTDIDRGGLRQNPNSRRVLADGARLPFRDGVFDLVMAENVFEHLEHPVSVLEEVARCLKPEKELVFLCPNKNSYIARLASFTPHWVHAFFKKSALGVRKEDVFPTLYRLNSVGKIRWAAERAGLRVESIRSFVGWPTYWEFSDLLHRIFVVVHKALERLPSRWHITLVGVLYRQSGNGEKA